MEILYSMWGSPSCARCNPKVAKAANDSVLEAPAASDTLELQCWSQSSADRSSGTVFSSSSFTSQLAATLSVHTITGCQEMKRFGLLLVVILTCSDVTGDHHDPDCEDCNENGSWFPLFQPSQIISSEFPEHEQYRSGEAPAPLTYATARPQVSRESLSHECEEPPQVVHLGSREVTGVDTPVQNYNGGGQHRVEWDHYGDVTTLSTVAYNSLEERGGAPRGVSGEDRSDYRQTGPEQDNSASVKSEEFFENGSFFDDKPSRESSQDFGNEYPFSGEHHHHGNSIEYDSHETYGRKPVATSYASISSVFESRPVPRARDLLHPEMFNEIPHYVNLKPVRLNKTRQYFVHEPLSREDPGVLRISHTPGHPSVMGRNKPLGPLGPRPSSFVPVNHPVYRYVKVHGGLNRKPSQSRSTLNLEDIHPQLRSKFPFKYLHPRVHVQNQENFVQHVVPTKDPFSDSFFKESQKIEDLKPPPLGQTLYYYKKKPNPMEMKNIARRRHSPGYMYIIRRNNKKLY
ncbi:uncharacterized protein LOC128995671 [Macrosteles quadrilineatus]|uniref:uncharacterized protein LOC128995671 n=1 Tax=Macrosteles quadrilineatus TaxID=74068 RepID=UPI0023E2FF0D|nr:uncharacterized protein LOC128995671 [Macrosteles quadrilineatus]